MSVMFKLDFETSTPNDFPILRPDPTIDSGTLLLWDPARSGIGAYANGTVFPDIASSVSSPIIGVAPSALSSPLSVSNYPTELLVEKTGKGGLHLMASQNAFGGNNRRALLPFSNALKTYIDSNQTNTYYVRFIGRFTRLPTEEKPFFNFSRSGYAVNYYFYMRRNGTTSISSGVGPAAGASYSPNNLPPVGTPFMWTLTFNSKVAATAWDVLTDAGAALSGFIVGDLGSIADADGKHASLIMYQGAINSLTISGKTAAAKLAEDTAYFNSLFVEGGRFYNDTWTVPVI